MTYCTTKIAASILGANPLSIASDLESVSCDWIHVDVMDGCFVPNISFGPHMVSALRERYPNAFLDVHLMIEKPEGILDDFIKAGASLISFHAEATPHSHRIVQRLHDTGLKAGMSITPSTPPETLFPMLPFLDLALVMSVNPGFGGQKFLDFTIEKLKVLACRRASLGLTFLLEMDGGINSENKDIITGAGCDVLVMGSSLFKRKDGRIR